MPAKPNPLQIATVSLSGTLVDKLTVAAAAGFDGVEIFENDLVASDCAPEDIRACVADLGLTAEMYQPFRDLEGWSGFDRERAFDRVQRKLDLMARLGCDLLLLCSNVQAGASGEAQRIAEDLRRLGDLAHPRGIRIAYEALAWGAHVNDHRHACRIVEAVDHPAIGLALDSFHSLARGIPVSSLYDIAPERIFFVQLADAPALQLDYLSWSRHHRNMPGQGDFPLVDYVAALRSTGYKGPLSLEIFNDRLRAGSARLAAEDGMRSLRALVDDADNALGRPTAMPRRQHCEGVEFVEFAADGSDATALETMLRSMGFAETGRHRAMQVSRWQQGSANIIVNREQQRFAHNFDVVHGAAVCALGLRVKDKQAAKTRACALGLASLDEPGSESRLARDGLRSVGGTVLYVIGSDEREALWQQEFVAAGEIGTGAGLKGIDHISATTTPGIFLSNQLLWTSLFDLEMADIVNIADPSGLVESRALHDVHGDLRVTMNASAAHNTLTNRHISRTFGAPFQHLAFATDDIFATARVLRSAGTPLLAVPANYYEDLAARFGLDAGYVDRLASDNIFYDRDATGEYLQLFTRAFDRRFFFEIVERRGYGGYGAINAPVRLASQARFGLADAGQ